MTIALSNTNYQLGGLWGAEFHTKLAVRIIVNR